MTLPMHHAGRRGQRTYAQAVLELALVAPVLVGLIVVIGQLTLLYLDYVSVVGVARETARWITTHPSKIDDDVKAHIALVMPTNLLLSEFSFSGGTDPGWSPSCTTTDECSTKRQSGFTQYVHLRYVPDHHVFLRGPLSLGFFSANPLTNLPVFEYSMMISQTALPPDHLQDTPTPLPSPTPTSTPVPSATATPPLTSTPTITPTASPTPLPTSTPTPPAIVVSPGLDISPTEGNANGTSWTVATFTGLSSNAGSYSASIDWGDLGQSAGTIAALGNRTFSVTGTHVYVDETDPGTPPNSVRVTVSDGSGNSAASCAPNAASCTHASVQDAVLTSGGVSHSPASPAIGQVLTVTAVFTDTNPLGLTADFSSVVYWGDSAQYELFSADALPTTATATSASFTLSHSHTYAAPGTYTIQVYAGETFSPGFYVGPLTTTVTVSPPPLVASPVGFAPVEGQAYSGAVASFVAAVPRPVSNYTTTITWCSSCGSTVGGLTYNGGTNTFTVSGNYTYPEESSNTVGVVITDTTTGDTASTSASVTVTDASLSGSASTVNVTAEVPFSTTVATFTDALANPPSTDFSATIDWGDASGLAGGTIARVSGSQFSVAGSHTYSGPGGTSYGITVTITDRGGSTLVLQSTARVALAAVYVSSVSNTTAEGSISRQVATLRTTVPGPYTATIGWADGTASTVVSIPDDGSGSFTVSASHNYDEGQFPAAITVTAPGGSSSSTSSSLSVADAQLHPRSSQDVVSGTATNALTSIVAHLIDDNASAPPCSSSLACDLTAGIDWGDGTSTSPADGRSVVVDGSSAAGFSVTGTHTYTWGGTYTITTTIRDDGGQTTTVSSIAAIGGALRPTPTSTPTLIPTPTSTPTPTQTTIPTATSTLAPTLTPTAAPTATPGPTQTPAPTQSPTPTPPPTPTPLPTATPTPTPIPIGSRE